MGAFCRARRSGNTPQQAEAKQLEYPWGAGDAGTGSLYAIYDDYYTSNDSTHIAPVGSALLGAGYWGQLDLAGEVDEWTLDWRAPYVDPCINCAYLTPSSSRAIRGGEFGVVSLVAPGRYGFDPTFREVYLGFRCARSAP
jgi:formylglycine-generating enzyme required for sulfatase activity